MQMYIHHYSTVWIEIILKLSPYPGARGFTDTKKKILDLLDKLDRKYIFMNFLNLK